MTRPRPGRSPPPRPSGFRPSAGIPDLVLNGVAAMGPEIKAGEMRRIAHDVRDRTLRVDVEDADRPRADAEPPVQLGPDLEQVREQRTDRSTVAHDQDPA